MSTIGKRSIWAGAVDGANQKPLNIEGVAVAVTTPGMVVKKSASGIEINNNAATQFGGTFNVADKDQMRSRSVDDDWAINENMIAIKPRSGEFINVLVVTGQVLVGGVTPLTRAASGGALTIAATDGTEEILCVSDESLTTSGTQLVRVSVA